MSYQFTHFHNFYYIFPKNTKLKYLHQSKTKNFLNFKLELEESN